MSQSHIYLFSKTTFLLDVFYLSVLNVFISPLTHKFQLTGLLFTPFFNSKVVTQTVSFAWSTLNLPSYLVNSSSSLKSHL